MEVWVLDVRVDVWRYGCWVLGVGRWLDYGYVGCMDVWSQLISKFKQH